MSPSDVVEACGGDANVDQDVAQWHIWNHHVETYSIRLGVSADLLRVSDIHNRVHRAYCAGEPVWAVVHELLIRHEARHPVRDHMRSVMRACEEVLSRKPE